MMTPNVTWVAACYGGFPRAKSPHYKPCSGSEKASGREKERVGSSAGRCAVETASCPPVCWSAGGKVRGPEEPHIGWKGVEESLELWGPSPIRARPPT